MQNGNLWYQKPPILGSPFVAHVVDVPQESFQPFGQGLNMAVARVNYSACLRQALLILHGTATSRGNLNVEFFKHRNFEMLARDAMAIKNLHHCLSLSAWPRASLCCWALSLDQSSCGCGTCSRFSKGLLRTSLAIPCTFAAR